MRGEAGGEAGAGGSVSLTSGGDGQCPVLCQVLCAHSTRGRRWGGSGQTLGSSPCGWGDEIVIKNNIYFYLNFACFKGV